MGISAKIIQSSISPSGKRIDTLEIELPRIVLAELNTHRAISKNAESGRAIPFTALEEKVKGDMFIPKFTPKQKGMQGYGEHDAHLEADRDFRGYSPEEYWREAGMTMLRYAREFDKCGYHKQVWSRLVEPFTYVKGIITATEWDNFFNLRIHHQAEPHIQELAIAIYEARRSATPKELPGGAWHIPYIDYIEGDRYFNTIDKVMCGTVADAIKIGLSLCAQVSYRKQDTSVEKADKICESLFPIDEPIHASPSEHIATPGNGTGPFYGWDQYRSWIPNNTCWSFTDEMYEKRIKEIRDKNWRLTNE